MNKILSHSKSLGSHNDLRVGCYSHFTDAELRLREVASPVQDYPAKELYCHEVTRSDVSKAFGAWSLHLPHQEPHSCPIGGSPPGRGQEGICAGGTSPRTRLSWGLESTERPVLLREGEPSIHFPALFLWKPGKHSMSTMLLGTVAYGKNDPIGKLHLGWEEL